MTVSLSTNSSDFVSNLFRMPREVQSNIRSFLTTKDRGFLAQVNKRARDASRISKIYEDKVIDEVHRKRLGAKPYWCLFSGVVSEILLLPRSLIKAMGEPDPWGGFGVTKKDTFQAVYIPAVITIPVNKDLQLRLENGRLVKGVSAVKDLHVPVTLNNIMLLLETYEQKNGLPFFFSLPSYSLSVQEQHGNTPVESHWSYQRINPIALGWDYGRQIGMLKSHRLEGVPLVDRLLFSLWVNPSDKNYEERTSTLVETRFDELPRPAAVKRENCFGQISIIDGSGPSRDGRPVGIAVQKVL